MKIQTSLGFCYFFDSQCKYVECNVIYMVRHNYQTWHQTATLCYYAVFFGTKIPTTKHEIMLHATSLKGGSRTSTNCVHVCWQLGMNWISALLIWQSGSGARVFVHVLKWKTDNLNTNWAIMPHHVDISTTSTRRLSPLVVSVQHKGRHGHGLAMMLLLSVTADLVYR